MNLEAYQELNQMIEDLQRKADRANGAIGQLLTTLKKDFDCSSFRKASELLKQLEKEKAVIVKDYNKAVADFEEKWRDKLENSNV